MKRSILGKTGIAVSELCFGTLPMGPLQADLPLKDGISLLLQAMDSGINFFDTAQVYKTYPYLKESMSQFGKNNVVIATKSTALDKDGMEKAIQEALKELNRDYIDIFHFHAARYGPEIFDLYQDALECLLKYKEKGYIRAVGIATHHVQVTELAIENKDIDIVFPIINKKGMGIQCGSCDDMIKAVSKVRDNCKGLYLMKCLAGGNLIVDLVDAFNFARNIEGVHAIAVGMVNTGELGVNIKIFNDIKVDPQIINQNISNKKIKIMSFLCKGCGKCVEVCPNKAISIIENKAEADIEKCLLCGYCTPECPEFAIRIR